MNPQNKQLRRVAANRLAMGVTLSAALLCISVPSAMASSRQMASRDAVRSTTACAISGWSSISPKKCASSSATVLRAAVIPELRGSGAGCSGWYTSSDNVMNCENTSITRNGYRVGIRQGYYNPEASPVGFGWTKALDLHNLWIQPSIDTIAGAIPQGSDTNRNYEVYHYNTDGVFDQAVLVIADIEDTDFDGISTHDGHPVGEITGYCLNDVLAVEQDCPDWVDTTL